MTCTQCTIEVPSGSQFCPGCGHQLLEPPRTPPAPVPTVQTLWEGHPTVRSFEGPFFLAVFLLLAGPSMYGLSYVAPFSVWAFEMQAFVDLVWGTIAGVLSFTEFVPHIPLIGILATSLFILACVLFVKLWTRSQQIRYRLTPKYLIITHGFLTRTQKQLSITAIKDMKLEQSFLDRLVRVGTIDADTSDPSFKHISIRGISSPTDVFDTFYRVWQDATSKAP
ncbi:MAG TPA: hypothetical protein EYG58_01235 [Nitrospirales bacterium]|nr:hypothetical protein [Nitrospirales bacterium]